MHLDASAPTARAVGVGLHVLFFGLLAFVAVHAATTGVPRSSAIVAVAGVTAAVYAAALFVPPVRRRRSAASVWLAAVTLCWIGLLILTSDAVWIAFPLYFMELHLLPRRAGLAAVAATALAAGVAFAAHHGGLVVGALLGPALGAAVAVATVFGVQSLHRENERRRRLIEELRATRAGLVEATHEAGVLAERERLAREIHDTLAQELSSIQLLLRAAQRNLPPGIGPAAGFVEQARVAAQDGLAEARHFVRALAPPALEADTLAGALKRLCTANAATHGLPTRFVVAGEPVGMDTAAEAALLRIAQSALANAAQHAEASEAVVTLTYLDTEVALDVVDDGIGFGSGTTGARRVDARTGFGLDTMRNRAREAGGTLTVESAPGKGTVVGVLLPISVAARGTR
jgi:signal transduction histidine kinase